MYSKLHDYNQANRATPQLIERDNFSIKTLNMPLNERDQSKLPTEDSELQALLRPYSAKPKVALSTTLGRAMDGLTYPQLFLVMFGVVLASALYFYLATPCGQGVIYNTSDKTFSFGSSIYFSVVTFTSVSVASPPSVHRCAQSAT
jgi:hypothetical protein